MYKIPANTLFIGKKLVFVPECHSTNTLATELSQKEDLPEGSVIITDYQVQGRGQQGNAWISERGKNLTFSVIVKPSFLAIQDQFLLNMAVSLAVKDFVQEKLERKVNVKWPNDIMVDDLKLCGILIENQIQGEFFSKAIIGIGLNVNQKGFFSKNATSISMITELDYDLQESLGGLLMSLESWYVALKQYKITEIRRTYLDNMYGINEIRSFKSKDGFFEGMILGVDDTGRLRIQTGAGTRYFNTKEVQFSFEPLK